MASSKTPEGRLHLVIWQTHLALRTIQLTTCRMELVIDYPEANRRVKIRANDNTTVAKLTDTIVERLKLPHFDPHGLRQLAYFLVRRLPRGQDEPLNPDGLISSQLHGGDVLVLRSVGTESPIASSEHGLATFRLASTWSVKELEQLLHSLRALYVALFSQNEILKDAKSPDHRYYENRLTARHEQIAANIASSEDLIVKRIQISSPGFLEVIGAFNPLETIRQYLKDRREADTLKRNEKREDGKDDVYRNAIEQAKAVLEIESLKTKVATERALLLRDAGFPQEEIRPYVKDLIEKPLEELVAYQTKGNFECTLVEPLDMERIEIIEDGSGTGGLALPGPAQEDERRASSSTSPNAS